MATDFSLAHHYQAVLVGNHKKVYNTVAVVLRGLLYTFCRKNRILTRGLDKIALYDVALLMQLVFLLPRSGVMWVVKGLELTRGDHCRIFSENNKIVSVRESRKGDDYWPHKVRIETSEQTSTIMYKPLTKFDGREEVLACTLICGNG